MLFPFHDNNPIRRWPWVTVLIILTNTVALVLLQQKPPEDQVVIYAEHGFIPKRIAQLRDPKLIVDVDVTPPEQRLQPPGKNVPQKLLRLEPDQRAVVWSLLTCMFLHAGWIHLVGNMWFLWVFGNNIEDRLGPFIYLLFYLMVGLLASFCHWAVDRDSVVPVVGASGAVAGVLGAYAVTFPRARVKTLIFFFIITIVELPALMVLFAWFALQIFQGMVALQGEVVSVAWWAHVGGFLAGVLMMPLMAAGAPEPGTHWEDEADEVFRLE